MVAPIFCLGCIIAPFDVSVCSSENLVPLLLSTTCNEAEYLSSRCSITLFILLTVFLGSQPINMIPTRTSTTTALIES
ncbi:hypothetical protein CRD60_06265 [Bifidobacterium aemilianum]|uniref:Uncharacterized protein n=1 Tax=Bifidobacterium aemilianum TaxID=2493120 RepID=A0A366K770_9BIFI|nr:hypothetical protein CRD60_06265 [Bifidobacterium aemilianum]